MEFDYLLTKFDTAAITLTMTTEQNKEPQTVPFSIERDTLNRRKFRFKIDWQPLAKYEMLIPEGTFENVAREKNDTLKASYTASDPDKFAIVKVVVASSKPDVSYIMQLTNAQGKVQKELFDVRAGTYLFEYVTPGDVMLRVIEDINRNGKWDSGDMVLMRQPERTEIYKNENDEELITTKANWEFELAVDMDKLFAPVTMQSVIDMLNDREDARLKKVAEEMEKKRKEAAKNQHNHNHGNSGMGGFGGMGGLGGNTGGMGGFGGNTGAGGLRGGSTSGRF